MELEERYRMARLIAGKLTNTLSEEENRKLNQWLGASEENRAEYENITRRLQEDLRRPERLNMEQEWADFKRHIPCRQPFRRVWNYVAAACVIGGMLIAGLLLRQEKPVYLPAIASVGGERHFKATLILEDGEEVHILDSARLSIPVDGEGKIVSAGNMIKYELSGEEKTEVPVYNTIVVPRGGEYKLQLSDGTQVWLNSESRLTYPVRFAGATREVSMEGEVCFEVAKNEQQPFVVKTGKLSVKVLGTFFNIEAYNDKKETVATLVRGKVEVTDGKERKILFPDQQAVVEDGRFEVKKVFAEEYVRWTAGVFSFTEASLEDIMMKLARWYDVEYFFTNSYLQDIHFSLEIKRYESIDDILSKIEKTGKAHFRVNGRTVIIGE